MSNQRPSLNPKKSIITTVSSIVIICSLITTIGCGGNSLPNYDNGEGKTTDPINKPDENQPISAADGSLVLTEFPESTTFGPPANVSVLFNVKTETGKPIANLSLDDFQLYENDTLISQFEAKPRITPEENEFVFSSLLLLDFSASVIATSLGPLKSGAKEFVAQIFNSTTFSGSTEVAVAIFDGSQEIRLINTFSSNPNELMATIDALDESDMLDSSTNLYGAIQLGLTFLENQLTDIQITSDPDLFVAGAMVLFTDGRDQAAWVTKEAALQKINQVESNLALFSIGLGEEIDVDILQSLGKNGFQQIDDLSSLVATFSQIAQLVDDEANSYYKLDYCSPKRGPGDHQLTIGVNYQGLAGDLSVNFSSDNFTGDCTL